MSVELTLAGHNALIDYNVSGGMRRSYRNRYGFPEGGPDDEAEVEVESIVDAETGENLLDLYDSHRGEIERACIEDAERGGE